MFRLIRAPWLQHSSEFHRRRVKSLCGSQIFFIFLGYVPLSLSPVKRERGRDRLRDQERESMPGRERGREREGDRIGLAALAGGYSLCCHGNCREEEEEEEEEGSVSISWGRASPLVCESTSGRGWNNTPAGDSRFKLRIGDILINVIIGEWSFERRWRGFDRCVYLKCQSSRCWIICVVVVGPGGCVLFI